VPSTSLEVREVYSGYYRGVDIVKNVSLEVSQGQVVALIGPNGCGKSTLLKTIYGFIKPSKGDIFFDGVSIKGKEPEELQNKLKIAFVPQAQGIFPELTVLDNLKLGMWSYRKDKKLIEASINRVFEFFPYLKEKHNEKAGVLSGGMRKMLEISRAIACEARLILLDEPTAGLAPTIVQGIVSELRDLKKHNIGMLIVDHNIRMLSELVDYVYVMSHDGRIAQKGSTEELGRHLHELIRKWVI